MCKVYWNSRKKLWSVLLRGQVRLRTKTLVLTNCKFIVRESGRLKVLKELKRNVHAFVSGELCHDSQNSPLDNLTPVRYNPYDGPHFVVAGTSEPVFSSKFVYFNEYGKVFAAI